MSIIFGVLKEPGAAVAKSEILKLAEATTQFATGPTGAHSAGRIGMGFQPYVSHARSAMDQNPVTDLCGNLLAFDGRLDNDAELAKLFSKNKALTSDAEIVLAGFRRWGEACFSRLVGDWALALWSARDATLYLARDHAGSRTLYFGQFDRRLIWATHLDTLLPEYAEPRLSKDYVGCYLGCSPCGDLTPYEGIKAVPAAHVVVIRDGKIARRSHWSAVQSRSIRYQSDREYEEHFLELFRQSVERRTGPGEPILAQLSGGMDSTSIVSMSDAIRRASGAQSELLDTISFYDDSESSLDERRYFSITEKHRGKPGIHINAAFSQRTFEPLDLNEGRYLLPGADSFALTQERRLHALTEKRGYRSILSGIGGDEVLGGVPSPWPELADHLVRGDLRMLVQRAIAWSLVEQTPLIHTLLRTARYTAGLYFGALEPRQTLPPWIAPPLRERAIAMGRRRESGRRRFGVAPHLLDSETAWRAVLETLPGNFPGALSRPEYRYPFLDKELVEFLFAIPPEQLQRPGRRRSLMRRALRGIVPAEILERRRKAFQLHAPLDALRKAESKIERLFTSSCLSDAGYVDRVALCRSLHSVVLGKVEDMQFLYRAIALELWLKSAHTPFQTVRAAEHRSSRMSLTA